MKGSITRTVLPRQYEFLKACENKRFVAFIGGIQSGKTTSAALQAWIEVARNRPPHRGWVVAPTYQLSEVPERDFVSLMPEGIKRIRRENSRRVYETYNGHTVEFKTADEPDRLRGERIGWVHVEEAAQISKEAVDILYGRILAYQGKIFITTTPKGRNWLYTDWYIKTCREHPDYDPDYVAIRSTTDENIFLPPREIERLKRKYTGTFGSQEILAEFVAYEGLVYKDFDPARHIHPGVSPEDESIQEVVCGIDFGFNDPFCCLWIGKKDGRWIVVDEYYQPARSMDCHAAAIESNPWTKKVRMMFGDYHGKQEMSDLRRFGINVFAAHECKPIHRINEVARLLVARLHDGKPALMIAKNCINTIREFGTYRYREASPDKDGGELPMKQDDHACDAVGYALYSVGSNLYHGKADVAVAAPGPGTYGWLKEQQLNGWKGVYWNDGFSYIPMRRNVG